MLRKLLSKYKYEIYIVLIVGLLLAVNYIPGTYLTGWDSLQTELNPGLAVKRAFFSVWQEYQSMGLVAGMAHATDLLRASLLWVMSFLLPQNTIRYFYQFLTVLVGGLGAFKLFGKLIEEQNKDKKIAFLGSIFYLLNLGTVQIYYVPFESFSAFFAFLPWAIWSLIKLMNKEKDSWRILFFVNLLGTPSFYSQQLFVVYLLVYGCIALGKVIQKPTPDLIKRLILAITLVLAINSFWILPQIYFLKSNGHWVTSSKANQIATEETLYQNLGKGTIDKFLKMEGFYYDLKGISNTDLFTPWKDHYSGIWGFLPYLFAILMTIGLLSGFINNRRKPEGGFYLIFGLCGLALLSATPPLSWLNDLIRQNGFINQIFRSPFTKFIIVYSLTYSYFVAKGLEVLLEKPGRLRDYALIIIFGLIIIYSRPSFNGFYISPEMKTKIPTDYFQVIEYFNNTDKNKRVALLPDYTFWGWFFNKWGYNGSGFLWYGIEQPIISRTFDVWSPQSESYFWEIKQALEAEDQSKFNSVLDKYQVDYLIMDSSLIPVVSSYKSLANDRIESLLSQDPVIELVYKGTNVSLFKVNRASFSDDFVNVDDELLKIGPSITLTDEDTAFIQNGKYTSSFEPDIYYPALNMTSQTRLKDQNWKILESDNAFTIEFGLPSDMTSHDLFMPTQYNAHIFNGDKTVDYKQVLRPQISDKSLSVTFDKNQMRSFSLIETAVGSDSLLELPELSQEYGYLIKIKSDNKKGSPLYFYMTDNTKKQSVIEEKLRKDIEYFILPPKFEHGVGYTISFQNRSYGNIKSENILKEVSIYLLPYQPLKTARLLSKTADLMPAFTQPVFEAKKLNYYTYEVEVVEGKNITLSQSYDPGWVAISNGKVLEHIKVSNWANGWKVGINDKKVTIVFWPQYLQYFGFILLAAALLRILLVKDKHE